MIAEFRMERAAIVQGERELRIEPDRLVVIRQRALVIALSVIGIGAAVEGRGVALVEADRLAVIGNRAIVFLLVVIDVTAAVEELRLVWDLADRLAIGGQRPVVEVALVEAVALPPGKHAEEAVARGGGRIRSGGRCDAGNRILDVAIMGCQPLDRFEIGAEILVDDLIRRIRIAARRGVRRGGLYQEIARPLAQPGSRLKIDPDIPGARNPHAAPPRRPAAR